MPGDRDDGRRWGSRSCGLSSCHRQHDPEDCAASRPRLGAVLAAKGGDDGLRNGETDTQGVGLAGLPGFEASARNGAADAGVRVGDVDRDAVGFLREMGRRAQLAPAFRSFFYGVQRVRDELCQGMLKGDGIARNRRERAPGTGFPHRDSLEHQTVS